jgi:integrase
MRAFLEFFAANISNRHTRRLSSRAVSDFLAWCADAGVPSIAAVKPFRVATWIESLTRELSAVAAAAGIATKIGNHTFRATGITAYLKNGGTLEKAASMANHASTRRTQLYDRRRDEMSLDEVERIGI